MKKTLSESILNSQLDEYIKEMGKDFDDSIIDLLFPDLFSADELSRVCTDSYGDAGSDYIFYTSDGQVFYELNDIKDKKDSLIDIYFIQSKNSIKIDSNVPQKFIKLMTTITQYVGGQIIKLPSNLNQLVNTNLKLIKEIFLKLAIKNKIRANFIYFGRFSKSRLDNSNDLKENFESLRQMEGMNDLFKEIKYTVYSIDDLIELVSKGKKFEYTFDEISRIKSDQYDDNLGIVSLIPIKKFYNFITNEDGIINERLFVSNIRDFKGNTLINKQIMSSLADNKNVDFWWLNNGITVTVEKLVNKDTIGQIYIENPQIVNGLQTSYSIFNFFKLNPDKLESEDRKLFIKFLEFKEKIVDQELNVIVATNRQNEIRDKDIRANDTVQITIEKFLKDKQKYYQRKDKYYTNRGVSSKDVIKLDEMAKYINTIYLKDPSGTRNNPGKLTKDVKYKTIFKIGDDQQDFNRYWIAYKLYEKVSNKNKGDFIYSGEQFPKINFIHHIVFITIIQLLGNKTDYTHDDLKNIIDLDIIDLNLNESYATLEKIMINNGILPSKVLKNIKETSFNKKIISYLESNSL